MRATAVCRNDRTDGSVVMKIIQVVKFSSVAGLLGAVVLCEDGSLWERVWGSIDNKTSGPVWEKIKVPSPEVSNRPK